LPPLRNPPKLENAEDLTTLSYLNEPSGKEDKKKERGHI
jgi:myosin heavy subunit